MGVGRNQFTGVWLAGGSCTRIFWIGTLVKGTVNHVSGVCVAVVQVPF